MSAKKIQKELCIKCSIEVTNPLLSLGNGENRVKLQEFTQGSRKIPEMPPKRIVYKMLHRGDKPSIVIRYWDVLGQI